MLCLLPQLLLAQTKNIIHGHITDDLQKPIDGAYVSLLNLKDSSAVMAVVTDKNGNYKLNLSQGQFILQFSAIGFTNKFITLIKTSDTTYDIQLQPKRTDLQNVFVTSKKPFIQIKPDKILLNVSTSINSTGSSIFDLLRKAPGVKTMGQDGISINGKTGLAVYMDRNKVNLEGQDLIDYLQSLTSSNIETIEIITNPSAKYDAAGNAGIINIITKKNAALGFNGNVSAGTNFSDYKPKYNAATNLNYREKNFNVYGNYSWLSANYKIIQDLFKIQTDNSGIPTTYDQHYQSKFIRHTNTYKVGADFFLSPKSTFGIIVDGNTFENNPTRSSTTLIYQDINKIDSQLISKILQPKNTNTINYNLNYRYKDSIGREFGVDANYGNFNLNSTGYLNNNYETDSGKLLSQTNYLFYSNTNILIKSINADYQQKLWHGTYSFGAKFSQVNSDNNLLYYDVLNNYNQVDTGQTNHFVYKEKVAAAYLNYNFTTNKWQFQLGARVENTKSTGNLTTITDINIQAVDTSYTNLFPNIVAEYKLNDNNSFGFIYNKRVDRPAYQDLNPFKFVLDDLLYIIGNPFLRPQFTSEIKLSHTFKQQFTTSLSYDNIKDFILNFRDTIGNGKIVQTSTNMRLKQIITLQNSAQLALKNWWDFYYNIDIFHEWMSGPLGHSYLNMSQTSWDIACTNTIKLQKKWTIELTGSYASKYLDAPAFAQAQWTVDVGAQKKILKYAGMLRISISDLFNTDAYNLTRNFGGLYFVNHNKWESRLLKLSFSYKFGNNKVKAPTKKTNGSEEEQSRIKNGQ